ncbi:MAG TPA: hypothetical protein VIL20_19915 [Sandaracinaceae bacterium]
MSLVATIVVVLLATVAPCRTRAQTPSEEALALNEAYRAKAEGNLEAAHRAFVRALTLGADPQLVHLELGYLALARGSRQDARGHFEAAANGPDRDIAENARGQLRYLPTHFWLDAYVEAWGWYRLAGRQSENLVPTLRLRSLWRPFLDFDLSVYLYGQITRDVSSRGRTATSLPLVYADNHALVGGGLLFRFLDGHMSAFAQLGPAFNLLDDGRDVVTFDARAGVTGGIASDECLLPVVDHVRAFIGGCAEFYGELVYVSRFDHDIVGMLRGRLGINLLQTGPVLWQPHFELRALGGKNGDYYNNLAELGVGHRWRLLVPFNVDLVTTLHGGVYYGVQNVDPVPDPPLYLELRALLTSYVEVGL